VTHLKHRGAIRVGVCGRWSGTVHSKPPFRTVAHAVDAITIARTVEGTNNSAAVNAFKARPETTPTANWSLATKATQNTIQGNPRAQAARSDRITQPMPTANSVIRSGAQDGTIAASETVHNVTNARSVHCAQPMSLTVSTTHQSRTKHEVSKTINFMLTLHAVDAPPGQV
jgi:hypothetical protein